MCWLPLDLKPGQTALDVGCGPGVNLADLAADVTGAGAVIGIDIDPVMAREARQRTAGLPVVRVLRGDAHALPLADASIDRARVDRMLQHVRDPALVIAELRRVARPRALIALAEPDWATLAGAADDLGASADFTRYTCSQVVRNASIGRQLARMVSAAGFTVRSLQPLTPAVDFEYADRVLGLARNSRRAVDAGYIEHGRAQRWLSSLARGPFLATFVFFTVLAEAPRQENAPTMQAPRDHGLLAHSRPAAAPFRATRTACRRVVG